MAQLKKAPRRIDNGLSDQNEMDDLDTVELQDSQSNGEANSDEMEDLNIG